MPAGAGARWRTARSGAAGRAAHDCRFAQHRGGQRYAPYAAQAAPRTNRRRCRSTPGPARFDALKAWRAEVAREHKLPACIVFHDAAFAEMAQAAPDTLDALGRISGVGAKKLEAYGREILRVLTLAPAADWPRARAPARRAPRARPW